MVDIKPERSPEQSDKVEFDQADLAKSVPIVHSLTLLDFLQVHCGLVNIIYVGLMLPPIVPMWCQPNGDIYITKLSHWTPNSEHGSAAFFWPGSTSAQNKPASTVSQRGSNAFYSSVISSNTGMERGDISVFQSCQ